ncbi:hypothetical protein [Chroococcidiopsis sp. CCNUC1]|uniref:hypothetical protein n=1 Tax=Chroococcidiopsis sp. CCNUC1 TaxID=2653189 RepID=UPI002021CAB6|nr:hypothetical protein [Chroococcidiopsis sp. CCNUC1]URD50736.1 hypothetical protein M5J74_01825 [Chroococcidiopsis sp. CCNUC1]
MEDPTPHLSLRPQTELEIAAFDKFYDYIGIHDSYLAALIGAVIYCGKWQYFQEYGKLGGTNFVLLCPNEEVAKGLLDEDTPYDLWFYMQKFWNVNEISILTSKDLPHPHYYKDNFISDRYTLMQIGNDKVQVYRYPSSNTWMRMERVGKVK